jgi:hypothetical protein
MSMYLDTHLDDYDYCGNDYAEDFDVYAHQDWRTYRFLEMRALSTSDAEAESRVCWRAWRPSRHMYISR